MAQELIKWEEADFKWDKAPTDSSKDRYTWDSVFKIFEEFEVGGPDERAIVDLDPKKKKKIIRLIMYLNGTKEYDEKKEVKNIKHYIEDIKLIAEKVRSKVKIENLKV